MESVLLFALERIKKVCLLFNCQDLAHHSDTIAAQLFLSGKTNQVTNQPIISLSQGEQHPKYRFCSVTQTLYTQALGNTLHKNTVLTYCVSGQMSPSSLAFFAEKA